MMTSRENAKFGAIYVYMKGDNLYDSRHAKQNGIVGELKWNRRGVLPQRTITGHGPEFAYRTFDLYTVLPQERTKPHRTEFFLFKGNKAWNRKGKEKGSSSAETGRPSTHNSSGIHKAIQSKAEGARIQQILARLQGPFSLCSSVILWQFRREWEHVEVVNTGVSPDMHELFGRPLNIYHSVCGSCRSSVEMAMLGAS